MEAKNQFSEHKNHNPTNPTLARNMKLLSTQTQNRLLQINSRIQNLEHKFTSNRIKTAKYTLINFIPKALLQQFIRVANIYFLTTAILQSIPMISPLAPFSAIGPLAFVLFVSLLREMIEDYRKHRNDDATNEQRTHLYNNIKFVSTTWNQVRVGDFVKVHGDEFIPSDMLIVGTSDENGVCYVETSNLDGERNLKSKQSIEQIQHYFNDQELSTFEGYVICDKPNNKLNSFQGLCQLNADKELIPIFINNLLLRGTKLKNTQWIVGLVIYAGSDCKIIMNQGQIRYKSTHIEVKMNYIIIGILVLQAILCLIMAIMAGYFLNDTNKNYGSSHGSYHFYLYYQMDLPSPEIIGLIAYFSFFILFNTLVPISLIISLETLKFLQTTWMEFDNAMWDKDQNESFRVLNSMIHEELGRVQYIFTDKTGTLTSNQMIFKGCCIRGIQYTDVDLCEIFQNQQDGIKTNILDDHELKDFLDFWLCVTICHEVIVDNTNGKMEYQGSSPDEVCLVQAAAEKYNFHFIKRTNVCIYLKVDGKVLEYQILAKMDFSSDRKRMSIIVRDTLSQKIIVYCKGADNIILNRLELGKSNPEQQLNLVKFSLQKFSKDGLRTLCFGYRYLEEEFYQDWNKHFLSVQMNILKSAKPVTLQAEMREVESQIEKNLILLGATALEDKLQDGVPETISDLHRAGIKIWMLTGDKLETAENIGYLCNLLNSQTKIFRIQSNNQQDILERLQRIQKKIEILQQKHLYSKFQQPDSLLKQQLAILKDSSSQHSQIRSVHKRMSRNLSMKSQSVHKSALEEFSQMKENNMINKQQKNQLEPIDKSVSAKTNMILYTQYALIIEGDSINYILQKENKEEFLKIIPKCRTVICCRSSPNQKAEVVSFVKKHIKAVTLSIGDGGNDVNMIQEADIGVGILGKEGNQAAAASDYYLCQFKYLWRLLFIHGRFNLVRTAYFVNFFFFKNMLFTFQQFYFAFYSGFSAQSFWEDGYLLNFNSIVTAVAPIYYGIFDKDVSPETSIYINHSLPIIYDQFKYLSLFGYVTFLKWFFSGLFLSLFIFFSTLSVYQDALVLNDLGQTDGIWQLSISCYWSSVLVTFLVIFTDSNNFSWLTVIAYGFLSVVLFFPIFVLLWDLVSGPTQGMALEWLGNLKFFITVFGIVMIVCGFKLLYKAWVWFEYPTIVDKVKLASKEWDALQQQGIKQKEQEKIRIRQAQLQPKENNRKDQFKINNELNEFHNDQFSIDFQQNISPEKDKGSIQPRNFFVGNYQKVPQIQLSKIQEDDKENVENENLSKPIRNNISKSNFNRFQQNKVDSQQIKMSIN